MTETRKDFAEQTFLSLLLRRPAGSRRHRRRQMQECDDDCRSRLNANEVRFVTTRLSALHEFRSVLTGSPTQARGRETWRLMSAISNGTKLL